MREGNMTAKLFRNSMAVAVSVMALSIILFMGVLYQYFSDQMMEALGTETWLVARGVELEGLNYLDGLDSENRVTWVAADGTVLFDSSTDSAAMENHGNREEIREAQENRLGAATRYSSTLAEQTLYSARRLSDGTVIRLASSQRTVWLLASGGKLPILVILVLALLLSVVLASRLSRSIIRPIAELDLEHPEDCDAYDELAPLLTRIKRQNDTIKQQMGQLQQKQTEVSALTENTLPPGPSCFWTGRAVSCPTTRVRCACWGRRSQWERSTHSSLTGRSTSVRRWTRYWRGTGADRCSR